jgi:hypothetical protein
MMDQSYYYLFTFDCVDSLRLHIHVFAARKYIEQCLFLT